MHLVFLKSIEGSDNFVLPSKSLLPPHGFSPALQVAPSVFLRLSDAGGRSGCCRREGEHRATGLCQDPSGVDLITTRALSSAELRETLFLKPSKNFPGWGDPS